MDYYFLDFHFDSQSLVLTRAGEALPIRNNEARLLAFFLADPARVSSKDIILDSVWSGKVVSEQAVFQAISNLRTLFGETAIKTFPKKGYQWQIIPTFDAATAAITFTEIPKAPRTPLSSRYALLTVLLILLIATVVFVWLTRTESANAKSPIIVLAPFAVDSNQPGDKTQAGILEQAILHSPSSLSIKLVPSEKNQEQILSSPEHFFARYKQTQSAEILIAGRFWQGGQQYYLAYYLQSSGYRWQGYLTANSLADIATQLQALLVKVVSLKLLWESQDNRLIGAQLQLLHNQYPQELAIHHQLIINLMMQGDLQSARLQAQELEQNAKNVNARIYEALALVIQVITGLDTQSQTFNMAMMDKAITLIDSVPVPLVQSHIREFYSNIYLQQKNFAALERNLLQALTQAERANAPEQEAQVLRVLAIFSYKLKQPEKPDYYLTQARTLFEKHAFPNESHALLDDLAGTFAEDAVQKEFFYRQALERFTPNQEAWVKEQAEENLVNLYISQQRWDSALQVFANENILSGAERVMRAQIYWAQKNLHSAQIEAEQAFKQANLVGEYNASLEAALLLAQLHRKQPELQKQYRDFIQKNASTFFWRQWKAKALSELGFTDPQVIPKAQE